MSNGTKHKLYDYQVTPPSGVWERITEELDESDLGKEYPSRLYEMEVNPPAAVWSAIAAELGMSAETTIRKRNIVPFIRYAAAAVVIAMLAWGGYRLFINNNSTSGPATPTVKNTPPDQRDRVTNPTIPITKTKEEDKKQTNPGTEEERNDRALEESKKTYAKLTPPARSKVRNANAADFHFTIDQIEPEDLNPATRYIALMTPDGNIIRMSKKWSDLVCCVSGAEQDRECVDQLKKWKEKLANPSLANSPGNFGDILSLVRSLQE